MSTFETNVRAAAVDTLGDYAQAQSVPLNITSARPRSIKAPAAYVDRMSEALAYPAGINPQRTVTCELVLLHGSFDDEDAAAQRDAFVDGYIAAVVADVHAAGPQSTLGVVAVEDDPTFIPDWLPREQQQVYFATRITLEGYQGD